MSTKLGAIHLSDGGHSENLGVVALVKRGVKNIIVIDAEHDPRYSFSGYINLKKQLSDFESVIQIKEIEEAIKTKSRLKKSLYAGEIKTQFKEGEVTSKIYYLKMGMPETLDKVILDNGMNARGKMAHAKYLKTLEASQDSNGNWNCSTVKDSNMDFTAWHSYSISSYSDYLNYENYVRHADKLPGDFFTSKFPQYTTIDQSFYLDQALAFIGLGYWEAQEIVDNQSIQSLNKILQRTSRRFAR